ncbi:MAG: GAF domain-containing protein [Candidatus Bathyarchaeota archaeon]|nr:GAF domain-containing protein [Candidatus Bathyarchaeota archaeon]
MTLRLKAREILKSEKNKGEKLETFCKLLRDNVHYYNWVGFYAINAEKPDELVLVCYEGEPTEHLRIKFGKGICGNAAVLRKTLIVQDVSKENNYLSCSPKVKSEIVIPIFRNNEIVGELDIDSHIISPFTLEDEEFLTEIARMVSSFL